MLKTRCINSEHFIRSTVFFEVPRVDMKLLIKLAFLIAVIESSVAQVGPVVSTTSGPVLGANRITETNRAYVSFQGIPYAQPPDGENRFRVRLYKH